MKELTAKLYMLIDELMRNRIVLSLKAGKSTTNAATGRVTTQIILELCRNGFTEDFINALEGEKEE